MRTSEQTKPFGTSSKMAAKRVEKPAGIRPVLFYAMFAVLFGTNVITLTGFLMSPDITSLFRDTHRQDLSAYEDRITQLRLEVDRLHSRQYAQAGNINLQMQELAQQQELLSEQHQYVRTLAKKAEDLGILTADMLPKQSGQADKTLVTGAIDSDAAADPAKAIAAVGKQIKSMMGDSRLALTALSDEATQRTDSIVAGLKSVGITARLPKGDAGAMGGPLEPAQPVAATQADNGDGSLIDEANAVTGALARFKAARVALKDAPVHTPMHRNYRLTSPFGDRKDPFTGGVAFHPGLDMAAPRGTPIHAAGAGKVIFAGPRGGYGNMVEIDHGDGVISVYGHMSHILTHVGDRVTPDTVIGKVGSTGRSTGPHLHFELRRKDKPINPSPFLLAGRTLKKYL